MPVDMQKLSFPDQNTELFCMGFLVCFFGLFFLMVKFGLGLDHFLYDLFIKLL